MWKVTWPPTIVEDHTIMEGGDDWQKDTIHVCGKVGAPVRIYTDTDQEKKKKGKCCKIEYTGNQNWSKLFLHKADKPPDIQMMEFYM